MLTVVLLAWACGTRGICESLGPICFGRAEQELLIAQDLITPGRGPTQQEVVMPYGMWGVGYLSSPKICSSVICTSTQLTKDRWSPFWLILECLAEIHVCLVLIPRTLFSCIPGEVGVVIQLGHAKCPTYGGRCLKLWPESWSYGLERWQTETL